MLCPYTGNPGLDKASYREMRYLIIASCIPWSRQKSKTARR